MLRRGFFIFHKKRLVRPLHTAPIEHRLLRLISAFRDRGHYAAKLDPLSSSRDHDGDERPCSWLPSDPNDHPDIVRLLKHYPHSLNLEPFNLEDVSRDIRFNLSGEFPKNVKSEWSINELVEFLVGTYCGTVGVEFKHIEHDAQRKWLQAKIEGVFGPTRWKGGDKEERLRRLREVLQCDHTATFINQKYPAAKVFGVEGCESLLGGLHAMLETASTLGCEGLEMGMAHRGRMNVLHNFFKKPLRSICNQFSESEPSELGDVKYHLGTRSEILVTGTDGLERTMHLSLAANPSHLEAVNPIVIGKCKAKQFFINDTNMTKVMPVLLHGDASFSGQGIVPECMELSNLPDYTVGGCMHIVINNQIGFTTDPRSARTSYHCTNPAKGVGAPIFHANGDDVDAVAAVCRLAVEWRQRFGRDCVVDIVCYRRHGHNTQDDPSITQPMTYKLIRNHPTTLEIYSSLLIKEGLISRQEIDQLSEQIKSGYESDYKSSTEFVSDPLEWLASNWQGAAIGSLISTRPYNQTGVRLETLRVVGESLTKVPSDMVVHKEVERLLKQRAKILESGEGVTMAFAEALAFGALMSKFSPEDKAGLRGLAAENRTLRSVNQRNTMDVQMQEHPTVHIRLSGQDVIRGTFNQRHAAIYCQMSNCAYWQLNHLGLKEQAKISVCNSSLSEAAVLGFEYGYSLSNEMALTIWEAQFGDFANNAQCVIDNFIASGEHKWNNHSSLVLLLPHGYDGQGPEHSSARLERFLQLVDDDQDAIPGKGSFSRSEMEAGFDALDKEKNGIITKEALAEAVSRYTDAPEERIDLTLAEIMTDLGSYHPREGIVMTKAAWCELMEAWCMHNSERKHNLNIVVPSTPAQYFHCLRRQIHRPYAKPLIVMSAKWLLHHKLCASRLEDMTTGTFFQRLIVEGGRGSNVKSKMDFVEPAHMRRIVFCSGKVFYHLFHARDVLGINDIILIRIEQIAPFPFDLVGPAIQRYAQAELVWCQEEPKNMGAWAYVKPRIETSMRQNGMRVRAITYIGRKPSASPASGGSKQHLEEQKILIDAALCDGLVTQ